MLVRTKSFHEKSTSHLIKKDKFGVKIRLLSDIYIFISIIKISVFSRNCMNVHRLSR
jgi:hypothetical protein